METQRNIPVDQEKFLMGSGAPQLKKILSGNLLLENFAKTVANTELPFCEEFPIENDQKKGVSLRGPPKFNGTSIIDAKRVSQQNREAERGGEIPSLTLNYSAAGGKTPWTRVAASGPPPPPSCRT